MKQGTHLARVAIHAEFVVVGGIVPQFLNLQRKVFLEGIGPKISFMIHLKPQMPLVIELVDVIPDGRNGGMLTWLEFKLESSSQSSADVFRD